MSWLPSLFRTKAHEQKLESELRFHFERQVKDHIAAGLSPEEAHRQTTIEFGGMEQIKERCRDAQGQRWLETTFRDLKFGFKSLYRSPGFSLVAVITSALGIGANAVIFSLINGVMLKPLPFPAADRLVFLRETNPHGGLVRLSTLDYLDLEKQSTVFENISANSGGSVTLTGIENPLQVRAALASPSYFNVFRMKPVLGRTFVQGEDRPGRDHVAIINNALWVSQFGADPGIIGRKIMLDGEPYAVIGVLPKGVYDRTLSLIWRPLAFAPKDMSRDFHWLGTYAILKPGVSLAQARAQIDAITKRLGHDFPKSNHGWGMMVEFYATGNVDADLDHSLCMLMAAVGMVLLIGCANLANLTLARGLSRQREVAIRAALGAGRGRLVRQFLTESILLSSVGGVFGLLIACGGVALLTKTMPLSNAFNSAGHEIIFPSTAEITIDQRVLLFTFGLSILTGIVFGLIPALKASKPDLTGSIKEGGPGASAGRSFRGVRGALIITEIAVAFVLLNGAGLLIRSFFQMQDVNTGIDSTNVVTAHLPLTNKHFATTTEFNLYLHKIADRINSLPGVRDVAMTAALPLQGGGYEMGFQIVGAKTADMTSRPGCFVKMVSPSYFRTLGIKVAKGRMLDAHDVKGAPPVAIINQTMAKRYFPGADPLGKHILVQEIPFGERKLGPDIPWEVVGVVFDEKVDNLTVSNESNSGIYVSEDQSPQTNQWLVVRGAMDPAVLQRAIRNAVHEINRDQVLDQMKTLEEIKAESIGYQRFRSVLLTVFALVALLLAGIGFYGVISYSVAQRTREIGIRTALGASSTNILGLIMRSGMMLTVIGLLIGIGGALALSQFLAFMLFNVGKYDPVTLAAVGIILFIMALLACYVPARRAMKVNPIIALRWE